MAKYNIVYFNAAVKKYKNLLQTQNIAKKDFLFIINQDDENAFYSIAPLSRAIHELKADMSVFFIDKKSAILDVLFDIWALNKDLKKGIKNKKTEALNDFIAEVDKKAKGKFRKIFQEPSFVLYSSPNGFKGDFLLPYSEKWFKKYKYSILKKTCSVILKQVYNIKKNERFSIGFDLIMPKEHTDAPLEDYLDSYAITRAMYEEAKKQCKITMSASTSKLSMLEKMPKIQDLKTTIIGCELSKNIDLPVFKKFKQLSSLLKINRIKISSATFFINEKGYSGEHLFGKIIGYPSPNKKTKWTSPGGFIYKLPWYPQTKHDSRKPLSRVGFTSTLPIDIFIETCNIDWNAMDKRNSKIIRIMEKSQKIVVESNIKGAKAKTSFVVSLVRKNGQHRKAMNSGADIRSIIDKKYYRETGIYAGTMANLPGGEAFTTPEYIKGTIVGDVVINIDQSYPLSHKDPIIITANESGYKATRLPKKIEKKFNQKKKEAWNRILRFEKSKALPKKIIEMKKRNFNKIGEFAVNTNPKARLCRYLIVNEKIANMIHIALGSGFEDDRATEYHWDIVIDSKRQKLDIYGITKDNKKLWIHKNGKFVI